MVAASAFVKMDVKMQQRFTAETEEIMPAPTCTDRGSNGRCTDVQLAGNAYHFGKSFMRKPTIGDAIRSVEVGGYQTFQSPALCNSNPGGCDILLIGSAVRYCFFCIRNGLLNSYYYKT